MKTIVVTLLYLSLCIIPMFGQAPADADDGRLKMVISTGDGTAFASSGYFYVVVSKDGNSYVKTGEAGVGDSTGTFSYTRIGDNTADLVITDTAEATSFTGVLTFETVSSGTYTFSLPSLGGFQTGTFTAAIPNDFGYATIVPGTAIGEWLYYGPWPWAYIDLPSGAGWAFLNPTDDGLWVFPGFDYPILLLQR
ncbi:hypothetical protein [Rubellicoccus peritrichatus]|uniref:Uncharacterized protein n=1 Tax=Rubellicoccus peritrichatus TaxID=3080537 RepID=A0AAQ3L806_9BACT|nr:hypothetical protein [Puniceicoccus sp. CR14]WOO39594.1 hypothetical protein RZN69_13300 [Puniceicoccus sp. CR14]